MYKKARTQFLKLALITGIAQGQPRGQPPTSFKNGGQCRAQALAIGTFVIEVTFFCRGDPAHVERSRGASQAAHSRAAAVAEEVHFRAATGPVSEPIRAALVADEAHFRAAAVAEEVHFRGATGPVSEPIRAALAADEAHFAGATRSADAGRSPNVSSMDVTRLPQQREPRALTDLGTS
jgi:hypothetical protein